MDIKKATNKIKWDKLRNDPSTNWFHISCLPNMLTLDFIEEFKFILHWESVTYYCPCIDLEFIRKYKHFIDWEILTGRFKWDEASLDEFKNEVNWEYIFPTHYLSEQFLRDHINIVKNNFGFTRQMEYRKQNHLPDFSLDFYYDFAKEFNWDVLSQYKMKVSLIRKMKDYVNWERISENQKLSEKFIHEFRDRVDWGIICKSQVLSEQFLRDHVEYLDNGKSSWETPWYWLSRRQKLSMKFLEDFQDKVEWWSIFGYQHWLTKKQKKMLKHCLENHIKIQF